MAVANSGKITNLLRQTNAKKIQQFLKSISPEDVSNADIVARTGVRPHQQVFQITRRLCEGGSIQKRRFGKEWRFWVDNPNSDVNQDRMSTAPNQENSSISPLKQNRDKRLTDELSEDKVKQVLLEWFERHGWTVKIAWGQERGADCIAVKGDTLWIIEVKGCGSRQQMRVNYFIAVLGETLQRMDNSEARYSVAFPDMMQFRKLWERLPGLAKERTQLTALFVQSDGTVDLAE